MTVQDLFKKYESEKASVFKVLLRDYYKSSLKEREAPFLREGLSRKEAEEKTVSLLYENFEKAYSNFLKVKTLPSEEICLVIRYRDECRPSSFFYDVCSLNEKDFLSGYRERKSVSSYEEIKKAEVYYCPFCFMFDKRENVLGYSFAEVSLSLYPVSEVLAAVFWELTWFGYSNEEAERHRKEQEAFLKEETYVPEAFSEEDFISKSEGAFERAEKEKKEAEKAEVYNFNEESLYYKKLFSELKKERAFP